jgi:predicted transcriptional regulator YdeE
MEQVNETNLVTKPAFLAVGLRWEGTFAEVREGGIRLVHQELRRRLQEIPHVVDPENFYGLSYHAYPGGEGFTHYAVFEVTELGLIPEGMLDIQVPALTYAKCEHRKGQRIDQSYTNIYAWIEQQGYSSSNGELTHFEVYPLRHDPYDQDPEFTIMIPVT